MKIDQKDLFYLTSRHGDCGSNVLFHNKNGNGYGTNLNELHLFSQSEAQNALNQDINSLPLLKSEVDKVAVLHVDCQYLDEVKGKPVNMDDECVVQIDKCWDGNDIKFSTFGGPTYNYKKASVVSYQYALAISREDTTIWLKSFIESIARATFQRENINTRKMITGPGIKYKKPRKKKPTTGKVRFNCVVCGKIFWEHRHPEDGGYCSDCGW